MKYLLTNLNQTNDLSLAVRDAISLAYALDPYEIKYDNLPSLAKTTDSDSIEDRNIFIETKIRNLISGVNAAMNVEVQVTQLDISNKDGVNLNLTLNSVNFSMNLKL